MKIKYPINIHLTQVQLLLSPFVDEAKPTLGGQTPSLAHAIRSLHLLGFEPGLFSCFPPIPHTKPHPLQVLG